jgi:hypothetical protein
MRVVLNDLLTPSWHTALIETKGHDMTSYLSGESPRRHGADLYNFPKGQYDRLTTLHGDLSAYAVANGVELRDVIAMYDIIVKGRK